MKWVLMFLMSGMLGCQPEKKMEVREQQADDPMVSIPEKKDGVDQNEDPPLEEDHTPNEEGASSESSSFPRSSPEKSVGSLKHGSTQSRANGVASSGGNKPNSDPNEDLLLEMRSAERAMKRSKLATSVTVEGVYNVLRFANETNPRVIEVRIHNYNSEPVILSIEESENGFAWQPYYKNFERKRTFLYGHHVTRVFYRVPREGGAELRGRTHFVTVGPGESIDLPGYIEWRSNCSQMGTPTAESYSRMALMGVYYDLTDEYKNYVNLYLMDDNYRLVHKKGLDAGAQSNIAQRIPIRGVSPVAVSPDRILGHHDRELSAYYYTDAMYFTAYPIEDHTSDDCLETYKDQ